MLSEKDAIQVIKKELPQLIQSSEADELSIYKSVSKLVAFTRHVIQNNNTNEVKHCFSLAEQLLKEGNNTVKNAVENVYVFSLSCLFGSTSILREFITPLIEAEYKRQTCCKGI